MAEYERVRWLVIRNADTGQKAMIDLFEKRLRKMQRRLVAWAELVDEWRRHHDARLVMVTLTYRDGDGYQGGHIRKYMKAVKQSLGDDCLGWAWVAEMQKRGAVHYHIMFLFQRGADFPLPDKSGMWPHGLSRVETARTAFYVVKYSGKEHQKDLSRFPKGCRLYGASVRFGGESMKARYRELAGLADDADREDVGEWDYVGTAVTEGYARNVLGDGFV